MPLRISRGIPIPQPEAQPKDNNVAATEEFPSLVVVPDFPSFPQQQTNWCWAACAEMAILHLKSRRVQQCTLANWLFGLTSCCASPSSVPCNKGCPPDDAAGIYSNWHVRARYIKRYPIPGEMWTSNYQRRPIELRIKWISGGHRIIVCGSSLHEEYPTMLSAFLVHDPWYEDGWVYYPSLTKNIREVDGVWPFGSLSENYFYGSMQEGCNSGIFRKRP